MARTKYSEDQRDKIAIKFIAAAREIIETEGVSAVTVRKVATIVGCNSAKLYFYFEDLDELVTMASMSYLEKYTRTLVSDLDNLDDNCEIFLHTWEVFCFYAFNNPTMFYQIFFVDHTVPLENMISEYYRLFPYQLNQIDQRIHDMLFSGTLLERNRDALQLLVDNKTINIENIELINELMLTYFYGLLKQRMLVDGGLIEMERMKEKFMHSVKYLINKEKRLN